MLALLLSQVGDPLSGGAGWLGAGLLGAVLGWLLMVHLPRKDKEAKEYADSHTEQMTALLARHDALVEKLQHKYVSDMAASRAEFKEQLQMVVDHCQRETEATTRALMAEFHKIMERFEGRK
jgi:hypothetical protein